MNIGKFDFMSESRVCACACVSTLYYGAFSSNTFSIFILGDVGNVTSDKKGAMWGGNIPKDNAIFHL